MARIIWFRRDLRIGDHPALGASIQAAEEDGDGSVLALYIIGERTWATMNAIQQKYLLDSLAGLNRSLDGNLLIKVGDSRKIITDLAGQIHAKAVHITASHTPHAMQRDAEVRELLSDINCELISTGSAYAIEPGRITKNDGTYYKVYTPFYKMWLQHGWRAPAPTPTNWPTWICGIESDVLPEVSEIENVDIPTAGEHAALQRWEIFKNDGLADYDQMRNRPDIDGTSRLSTALRFGEIHPRTLLADLDDTPGHEVFRKEIAWREFYADILFNRPDTEDGYYNDAYEAMQYDSGKVAEERFTAWTLGQTGYPFVDAGMRQLRQTGWMHNRVRMVVASFLIKDLHIEWTRGAEYFEQWLLDFDPASNSHGWQWTAGCGTDASPYYRVFNPIGQGQRFDPDGDYIKRFVPELRHLEGPAIHEPWNVLDGYLHKYPERIVDHAAERVEALSRLSQLPKGKVQTAQPFEK